MLKVNRRHIERRKINAKEDAVWFVDLHGVYLATASFMYSEGGDYANRDHIGTDSDHVRTDGNDASTEGNDAGTGTDTG
jgi:hypothetical protein